MIDGYFAKKGIALADDRNRRLAQVYALILSWPLSQTESAVDNLGRDLAADSADDVLQEQASSDCTTSEEISIIVGEVQNA